MPELPEVETIRMDLNSRILNKEISEIKVLRISSIKNSLKEFENSLKGNAVLKVERKGKLIIFKLKKDQKYLLVHLKMTGQLIYCDQEKIIAGGHSDNNQVSCIPNKWTRVEIIFSDSSKLLFNDLRTFGYLNVVTREELLDIKSKFGPEPLEEKFNFEYLFKKIKKRTISIKALLLNQEIVSGIGNIYVDEILFASGVLPWREAKSLNEKEVREIVKNSKRIIKKAISKRGTTFNNYVDADGNKGGFSKFLKVYNRKDKMCVNCKARIMKIRVAGRGTHYCPVCQK